MPGAERQMKIGAQVLAALCARLAQAFCMAALLVVSVRSWHQLPSCLGALSSAAQSWVPGTGFLATFVGQKQLFCTATGGGCVAQQAGSSLMPGNACTDTCRVHHFPFKRVPA